MEESIDKSINEELLTFFKVLADANRLKIIGLLSIQPHSVEELAELVHLSASTVSHHLSRLNEAGFVTARADGYYNVYSLQTGTLEKMAQRLLTRENLAKLAVDEDLEDYERKVLNTFLHPDGRLKDIPAQRKKFDVILKHAVNFFQPDVRYTEKEVNEILSNFFDDYVTLRRSLIDLHLMTRQSGIYWRTDGQEAKPG